MNVSDFWYIYTFQHPDNVFILCAWGFDTEEPNVNEMEEEGTWNDKSVA